VVGNGSRIAGELPNSGVLTVEVDVRDPNEKGLSDDDAAFELLTELERQTPEEIRRQRTTHRIALRARVLIQPGNASEMLKLKVKGVLGDISSGGCRIVSPLPLRVGDVYRLSFEPEELDLPLTFARCLRCRLVREDVFETGFQFFRPVHLPAAASRRDGGDGRRPRAELLA
jgi:hypothetical protein